jgi:CubicO group peptidase (beta-lactamase class C family)
MSKFFTAAAVAMLKEEGKLDLDDEITRFLPEYPVRMIRIRHLLSHTSGVWDYLNLPKMQAGWREEITVEGLIDLFKDHPLEFEPGHAFGYSNSNYILLGAIIEKVSGQSYETFIDERIFQPAGMKHSQYGGHRKIIPNRAAGYEKTEAGYLNAEFMTMSEPYAAGGHVSTVHDLYLWNKAYFKGSIPDRRFKLENGKEVPVSMGYGISRWLGRDVAVYAGGIIGFRAQALYLPEDDLHVVILTNNPYHGPPLKDLAAKLAAAALGTPLEEPSPIDLEERKLVLFEGTYRVPDDEGFLARGGEEWKVSMQENGLYFRAQRILPVSENEFFMQGRPHNRIEFVRDEGGKVMQLLVKLPLLYPQRAIRVD